MLRLSAALLNCAFYRSRAAALRAAAGPAHAPGSAVGRPARRSPGRISSANTDQSGSSVTRRYRIRCVLSSPAYQCPSRGHRIKGGPAGPSHAIGSANP
jgi:hypothetical protein